MKRPFFETFSITLPPPGISPRRRIVVPSFGKTFSCLPNYNYLFVSFLIRFSMNNRFLANGFRCRPLDLAPKVYFVLREDEIKGRKST